MRDLILTVIVFGSLPWVFRYPYIGVLMWSWLGYMNPHRLAMGFAFFYPFSQVVAATTLIGLLFSRESKRIPVTALTVVWVALIVWMNISTLYALVPEEAIPQWERVMKIQLISFVTVMVMINRERINLLVWVIVVSLGFYGVKGGVFSILTGGESRVFGPRWSFIEDNNALALALIMTLPLMYYLYLEAKKTWVRWFLRGLMGLSVLSIFTSHSRGALVAGVAMGLFFLLKSPHKFRLGLATAILIPLILAFMPESWFERMETLRSYEQDSSAMSRINAWQFSYNLALDHPATGGGFNAYTPDLFRLYAPDPVDVHSSHSIYFSFLGEHGFVGLGIFVVMGFLVLHTATWIRKNTKGWDDLRWARNLATMVQVSVIGYAIGGAFLPLAYFDLYYHLVGMLVILRKYVTDTLATRRAQSVFDVNAPPVTPGSR